MCGARKLLVSGVIPLATLLCGAASSVGIHDSGVPNLMTNSDSLHQLYPA